MQAIFKSIISTFALVLTFVGSADSHNFIRQVEVPAGHKIDLDLLVTHGCKGSPVKELRLKIPENIYSVSTYHTSEWDIELTMRKLETPRLGEGGIVVTEVVDQITWKNPKKLLPASHFINAFRFRATMPDTPNEMVFFKSINVCEKGTDPYVDLPDQRIDIEKKGAKDEMWKFLTATPTPAPFVILRKTDRKQYPWQWTQKELIGPGR